MLAGDIKNYAPVTTAQEEDARWLASLGVDVVAGHHAHDVQPIELRGRTVIFYSLGNYAWGAPGHDVLRAGLLARLRIVPRDGARPPRVVAVDVIPIVTQNRIVHFQPRPLLADEMWWLDGVVAESRRRGADLQLSEDGATLELRLPE